MTRALTLAGIVAALVAWGPAAAAPPGAAPMYVTSDPEPGEQRDSPPDQVTITFSEPLDDSSKALVLDECDRRIDDRTSEVFANELSVGIATTPTGEYRVFYEATGAGGATGTTRGAFGFEVTAGPPCGGHDDHGGTGDGGHGGNGHGGEHSGTGDHGGETHGEQHGEHAFSGDHDHAGTMVAAHSEHDGGKTPGGRHAEHGDDVEAAQELQARPGAEVDLAARPTTAEADGTILALGLALAAALGVLGGWFLRVSTPS